MHFNIEHCINDLSHHLIPEMDQFQQFYRRHILEKGLVPHRTEWRICAPEIDVAGSVDFVARSTLDGTFHIFDWKRSDKFLDASNGYGKFGRYGTR